MTNCKSDTLDRFDDGRGVGEGHVVAALDEVATPLRREGGEFVVHGAPLRTEGIVVAEVVRSRCTSVGRSPSVLS